MSSVVRSLARVSSYPRWIKPHHRGVYSGYPAGTLLVAEKSRPLEWSSQQADDDVYCRTQQFWATKGSSLSTEECREAVAAITGFIMLLDRWDRAGHNHNIDPERGEACTRN